MSVYVDTMRAPFGRMVMCHMIADTHAELVDMADKIGLKRKWLQMPGSYREHFDVSLSCKEQAILNGAILIGPKEVADLLNRKRLAK